MSTQHCACGAKYRFDASAIGKKARCKKCGNVFIIEPDVEDGPIPLADEEPFAAEAAEAVARGSVAPTASLPEGLSSVRPPPVVIEEPEAPRSYWGDLLAALLFPTSLGDLVTFFVLWGLLCVSAMLLGAAGCLGFIGKLIILGWYCAFRFGTIARAAAGEDGFPRAVGSEGPVDEIVYPLFKWLGSWAVVFLPAIVCLFVLVRSGVTTTGNLQQQLLGGVGDIVQSAGPEALAFVLFMLLGLFVWPMVILCIALGGFETLFRVDLMVVTIGKTFPVYLLTAGMVFGAGFVSGLTGVVLGASMLASILGIGAALYAELVAMQAIGLYYHHFKHRFAWSWE